MFWRNEFVSLNYTRGHHTLNPVNCDSDIIIEQDDCHVLTVATHFQGRIPNRRSEKGMCAVPSIWQCKRKEKKIQFVVTDGFEPHLDLLNTF